MDGSEEKLREVTRGLDDRLVANPEFAVWKKTYRIIKSWITSSLSDDAMGVVVGGNTTTEVWESLTQHFSPKSKAEEFELLADLRNLPRSEFPS